MAEDDEYYDSIDDSEFESCRSFCNAKFQEESDVDEDTAKLQALVPFYTGNVEIDSIKNDSKNNSRTNIKNKLKRRNKRLLLNTYERRKNRSYLTMFYEKTGLQSKSVAPECSQATCENCPKSCVSYDQDDKTSCYFNQADDSESSYDKYLDDAITKINNCTEENESLAGRSSLESISNTRLYNVLDVPLNSRGMSKQSFGSDIRRPGRKTKPIKVYELGGLGPNIEQDKLELLKRRQDYGKTVSQKNRIKIMENKIVQKLKDEIQESKI